MHLRNILNGADLSVGGDTKHKLSIRAGVIDDGTNISSLSAIGALTATSFGDGSITAPAIGALHILAGSFDGMAATPGSLGPLSVTGGDLSGIIDAGKIGPITVKADRHGLGGNVTNATITGAKIGAISIGEDLSDSLILAGAQLGADHALGGAGADADTFSPGTIAKFRAGGSVSESRGRRLFLHRRDLR